MSSAPKQSSTQADGLAHKISHLNFDVDKYLNPFVPCNRLDRLPRILGRFLGYRPQKPGALGNVIVSLWSFVGAFAGVALIEGVYGAIPSIEGHQVPLIIASFVSERSSHTRLS